MTFSLILLLLLKSHHCSTIIACAKVILKQHIGIKCCINIVSNLFLALNNSWRYFSECYKSTLNKQRPFYFVFTALIDDDSSVMTSFWRSKCLWNHSLGLSFSWRHRSLLLINRLHLKRFLLSAHQGENQLPSFILI